MFTPYNMAGTLAGRLASPKKTFLPSGAQPNPMMNSGGMGSNNLMSNGSSGINPDMNSFMQFLQQMFGGNMGQLQNTNDNVPQKSSGGGMQFGGNYGDRMDTTARMHKMANIY